MNKLILLTALVAAAGCSKKANYERACTHMIDLAKADLDKEIAKINELDKDGSMSKLGKDLRDGAEKTRGSDLATCIAKSEEHHIDADCILAANTLDETQPCLISRK